MPEPSADGSRPARRIAIADHTARLRTSICGIVIADSTQAKILREDGYPAVFYFPPGDVRLDEFMTPTSHRTICPFKGEAQYWSFALGERREDNIAWAYPDPLPACAAIQGHIAFYWQRMDVWFQDDQPLQAPPP